MKSSNFGIQLIWIVSLYTRLDKSYTIFLPNIIFLTVLSTNSSFLSVNPWCTWQWRILYKITKKVYIQQYFKFIVRKLEIRPVPFFFLNPRWSTVALCKFISYSMFNLLLLHFSDQEVCNVYRSRGNTTAACKHVTSYFLFFFLFFKLYCSFFISGYSESKGATAHVS